MEDKLHVVLDLDGTLVATITKDCEMLLRQSAEDNPLTPIFLYFLQKEALFHSGAPHYHPQCILPAATELLQWLFSPETQKFIEVAFFSAGSEERNKQLVTHLLNSALGTERTESIMMNLKIYSAQHCSSPNKTELDLQTQLYGIPAHKDDMKKDLAQYAQTHSMRHTLLVDDNPRAVRMNQMKSYLATVNVSLSSFYDTLMAQKNCDSASDPLFQECNSIFYIAGMLKVSLDYHIQQQQQKSTAKIAQPPVTEMLFNKQFSPLHLRSVGLIQQYVPAFHTNFEDQSLYELGLLTLQSINHRLRFVTPSEIAKQNKLKPTPMQQATLDKIIMTPQPTTTYRRQPTTTIHGNVKDLLFLSQMLRPRSSFCPRSPLAPKTNGQAQEAPLSSRNPFTHRKFAR